MDVAGRAALVVEVLSDVVLIVSGSGDDIVAVASTGPKNADFRHYLIFLLAN
jgi:hypothetical protein